MWTIISSKGIRLLLNEKNKRFLLNNGRQKKRRGPSAVDQKQIQFIEKNCVIKW